MNVKGILALDIDGTVTDKSHHMPPPVQKYLEGLVEEGWALIFITGRTFDFGYQALKPLQCPYYFTMFNGAMMLKMPERKLVRVHHLPNERIPAIIEAATRIGIDPMFHDAEVCYWRPTHHDEDERRHLEARMTTTGEKWMGVDHFDEVGRKKIVYAKLFGPREQLQAIADALKGVATTVIGDPLREGDGVMLVTHPVATKGGSLRDFRELVGSPVPAIAAGDDYNDLTMIEEADIGISMESAPNVLKEAADIIATDGIVAGIKEALISLG